jgi:hypothetical protein
VSNLGSRKAQPISKSASDGATEEAKGTKTNTVVNSNNYGFERKSWISTTLVIKFLEDTNAFRTRSMSGKQLQRIGDYNPGVGETMIRYITSS